MNRSLSLFIWSLLDREQTCNWNKTWHGHLLYLKLALRQKDPERVVTHRWQISCVLFTIRWMLSIEDSSLSWAHNHAHVEWRCSGTLKATSWALKASKRCHYSPLCRLHQSSSTALLEFVKHIVYKTFPSVIYSELSVWFYWKDTGQPSNSAFGYNK